MPKTKLLKTIPIAKESIKRHTEDEFPDDIFLIHNHFIF